MEDKCNYTGRKIAIFTDSHSLLEPTVAVLEDIQEFLDTLAKGGILVKDEKDAK